MIKARCAIIMMMTHQVCKAKQNSGKTIWLGVSAVEASNEWKVVVIVVIYIIMVTMFQTPNGSTPSYFNWKDNSALGNCAYLFTKVII